MRWKSEEDEHKTTQVTGIRRHDSRSDYERKIEDRVQSRGLLTSGNYFRADLKGTGQFFLFIAMFILLVSVQATL